MSNPGSVTFQVPSGWRFQFSASTFCAVRHYRSRRHPRMLLRSTNRAVALEGCSPGPRRFPFPPSFTKRRHSELVARRVFRIYRLCRSVVRSSPWKAVVQGLIAVVCCFAFSVIPLGRHPGVSLSFLCHFALRTYKKGPAKYCREPPIPQNIYKHTL